MWKKKKKKGGIKDCVSGRQGSQKVGYIPGAKQKLFQRGESCCDLILTALTLVRTVLELHFLVFYFGISLSYGKFWSIENWIWLLIMGKSFWNQI